MFKQRPTRLANPLERCWQGGALCSTSAAAVLIFRGYLTVALSRSLSPLLPWQHIFCMEIASLAVPTAEKNEALREI